MELKRNKREKGIFKKLMSVIPSLLLRAKTLFPSNKTRCCTANSSLAYLEEISQLYWEFDAFHYYLSPQKSGSPRDPNMSEAWLISIVSKRMATDQIALVPTPCQFMMEWHYPQLGGLMGGAVSYSCLQNCGSR